jgi:hypothetical protein
MLERTVRSLTLVAESELKRMHELEGSQNGLLSVAVFVANKK